MKDKSKSVGLWIAGLVFATCPLIFDWMHRLYNRKPPPLVELIIHGEILLIAIAIMADTFIKAVSSKDSKRVRTPLIVGGTIALLLLGYDAGQLREFVTAAAEPAVDHFVVIRVEINSLITFMIAMILSLTAALTLED